MHKSTEKREVQMVSKVYARGILASGCPATMEVIVTSPSPTPGAGYARPMTVISTLLLLLLLCVGLLNFHKAILEPCFLLNFCQVLYIS